MSSSPDSFFTTSVAGLNFLVKFLTALYRSFVELVTDFLLILDIDCQLRAACLYASSFEQLRSVLCKLFGFLHYLDHLI